MTPTIYASPSRPFEYDRRDGTKPDGSLESTLQAYEVRELTERELGQFLAEIVFKHVKNPAWSAAETESKDAVAAGAQASNRL